MRIIAHTKYGVFEGIESEYDETKYKDIQMFLEKIADFKYFSFETDKGEVYMMKEMIEDTLFILEK
jgi:virulence-associated protein VapD